MILLIQRQQKRRASLQAVKQTEHQLLTVKFVVTFDIIREGKDLYEMIQ